MDFLDCKEEINYNLPDFWLFKVIGKNTEEFESKIKDFIADKEMKGQLSSKLAKNEKHISYTFEIYVTTKDELFEYYKYLKEFEETVYCL